jgi:hypothetical protein
VARRSVDFVAARQAIESPTTTVLVSAGSLWEILIKGRLGKLNSPSLLQNFDRELEEEVSSNHRLLRNMLSELVSCQEAQRSIRPRLDCPSGSRERFRSSVETRGSTSTRSTESGEFPIFLSFRQNTDAKFLEPK